MVRWGMCSPTVGVQTQRRQTCRSCSLVIVKMQSRRSQDTQCGHTQLSNSFLNEYPDQSGPPANWQVDHLYLVVWSTPCADYATSQLVGGMSCLSVRTVIPVSMLLKESRWPSDATHIIRSGDRCSRESEKQIYFLNEAMEIPTLSNPQDLPYRRLRIKDKRAKIWDLITLRSHGTKILLWEDVLDRDNLFSCCWSQRQRIKQRRSDEGRRRRRAKTEKNEEKETKPICVKCGSVFVKGSLGRHKKTQKCINFVAELDVYT